MAAVQVLGDLLAELDRMPPHARLLSLVQGVLAANIFDWGAQACVDLYHDGTILDIYQKARRDISQRPWRVDDFDALDTAWFARSSEAVNARGVYFTVCIVVLSINWLLVCWAMPVIVTTV
jgi:Damage-control phosphatase ARMT1-like domain